MEVRLEFSRVPIALQVRLRLWTVLIARLVTLVSIPMLPLHFCVLSVQLVLSRLQQHHLAIRVAVVFIQTRPQGDCVSFALTDINRLPQERLASYAV
jgi:hypothetical protein